MRIGITTPNSGFAGGLERYAWMVAAGLKARGHEVRHLYEQTGGRDPDSFAGAFSEPSRALSSESVTGLDVVFAQRIDHVHELAPFGSTPLLIASHDHAHTCVRTYRYLPLGRTPCHRAPGPMCIMAGCALSRVRKADKPPHLELRNPYLLKSRVQQLAERAPLVACSRYVADNLVRAGVPRERTHVIHPIPTTEPAPRVPRPKDHRLVVVAQLVRGKGIDIAIEAMRHLPARVSLRVVGDGPSRMDLQRLADRVAPGRVEFTGYVAPEEVYHHYDAARVVLVPSRWPEPFGMVGIEAMRRARPVVAARHGGIPEWAADGRGGRLFEPGSSLDLAHCAREMLLSEEAGDRALEFTTERHKHENLLTELENLLLAQLKSRPAH